MKKLLAFILFAGVVYGVVKLSGLPAVNGGETASGFMAEIAGTPRATLAPPDKTATAAAAAIAADIREATVSANRLSAENANATAVSIKATADFNAIRATQIVEQSTAAQAEYYRRETAAVDENNRRETASAAEAAVNAQSTADARAALSQGWTATADAAISAGYAEQTRVAGYGTATSISVNAGLTQVAATAYVQSVERAKERADLTNQAIAVLPFAVYSMVVIFCIAVSIAFLPVLRRRISVIFRDKRGDSPLVFDDRGNIADPDRNPFPFMRLGKNAEVPESIPADLADRTTARDQLIDYQTRGIQSPALPGTRPNGAKPPAALNPATAQARALYRVFAENETPDIPPDTVRVLDAEWREAKNG